MEWLTLKWPLLGALVLLPFCSRGGEVPADPILSPPVRHGGPVAACDLEAGRNCGAGNLPRVTGVDWSVAQIEQLLRASHSGTVAVDRREGQTTIVPGCHLAGAYSEVQGERLGGRFWATNRILFDWSELGADCATASHVVAAFVTVGTTADSPGAGATGSRSDAGPWSQFAAILTPLPCPPSTFEKRAEGCIGRGLTGRQRQERALQMWHPDHTYKVDISDLFDVYALFSDDGRGLEYLQSMDAQPHYDCFLRGQVIAKQQHKKPGELPRFDPSEFESCEYRPPFLTCFPGLFDPAPGGRSCWRPAGSQP